MMDFYETEHGGRFVSDSFLQVINDLERQCEDLAEPILERMGKHIVNRIKDQWGQRDLDDNLGGVGLNIIDQMSIYYQHRNYWEFSFGFEDYLDDLILYEIDDLSELDRMILEHRDVTALSQCGMDSRIFRDVKNAFSEILDEHYRIARVQRAVLKYDLHG